MEGGSTIITEPNTLLIVDDDSVLLKGAERLLEKNRYVLITASTGE
jgi:ActR/RegA family two-component response regulator